ncbi:MAG TPA: hypothetical protein VNL17_05410 [Verrucomicrobiae bacterium]|nr:hypothetical protein [Verrucomicrobiae bacterium]
MKTRKQNDERGIALILTLTILAVILILLLAFVSSMRTERISAKAFNDQSKAQLLAQAAIDRAVATIASATAQRIATPTLFSTYVTFPGVIWTNYNGTVGFVNLYSDPTLADPTNMNDGYWITGQNPLEYSTPANVQINVGWLYVGENGAVAPPPLAANNHLVGRYAFWVDDEATKVNIQTAGQRPVTAPDAYGYSTNSEVDLNMLQAGLSASAGSIQATQGLTGFTTIEEVKRADVGGSPSGDFTNNQFYLTTYSNDANYPDYADDFDALDRERSVLSTLNIRDVNGSGGGGTNNAYAHLSDPALGNMYSLSGPLATFDGKYSANGLRQIVANIIAYQHDPQSLVDPQAFPLDGGGTPPVFLGLAKTPYINEVQVAYNVTGADVTRSVSVELFYMYDTSYTAAGDTITISGLPAGPGFSAVPVTIPVSGTFASGSYVVFTETPAELPVALGGAAILPATSIQITYARPYAGTPRRLDYSGVTLPALTLDTASPGPVWYGAQAADPCVNDTDALPGRWEGYTSPFVGTLGRRNIWQGANPFDGTPGPAGYPFGADMSKAVIRAAPMKSLGELGFIHTTGSWQYVRLQPQPASEKATQQIPDWAMLDLFTVGGGTSGRININGGITAGTPVFGTTRLVPLNALLNNALTTLGTVPQNIYADDFPAGRAAIDTYGMRNGRDGIFDTAGEICEVNGLDNGGGNDFDREAVIRRIANDITVRSSMFTVWVWAQSIKDVDGNGQYNPPANPPPGMATGNDFITGEVKAQAVVERYENPPGSGPRYRIRYLRYY